MKKVLFTAAAFVLGLGASAQFEAGSILLSGGTNLGFSSTTTTLEVDGDEADFEQKNSNFGLSTSAGYFVADGLAVGLMINFNSMTSTFVPDEGDETADKSSVLGVGPMVRYYIGESGLFGQGYLTFGSQNSESEFIDFLTGDIETVENSASALNLGVGVGYAVALNDNLYLEPMLSYGSMRLTEEIDTFNDQGEEETVDGVSSTGGITFSVMVTGILN